MTDRLVIDRLWLSDYLQNIRMQIRTIENIMVNLEKARAVTENIHYSTYDSLIRDLKEIEEEFRGVHDILGEIITGTENASAYLKKTIDEHHSSSRYYI